MNYKESYPVITIMKIRVAKSYKEKSSEDKI